MYSYCAFSMRLTTIIIYSYGPICIECGIGMWNIISVFITININFLLHYENNHCTSFGWLEFDLSYLPWYVLCWMLQDFIYNKWILETSDSLVNPGPTALLQYTIANKTLLQKLYNLITQYSTNIKADIRLHPTMINNSMHKTQATFMLL